MWLQTLAPARALWRQYPEPGYCMFATCLALLTCNLQLRERCHREPGVKCQLAHAIPVDSPQRL